MEKNKLRQFKKDATRPDDKTIQKGLSEIYSNQEGSVPDISHLELKRKNRLKIFLITSSVIVFLLAVVAWLGFLIFNPDYQFQKQSINLTIEGPKNISSGDDVTYTLKYKNNEKVILKNVEIILRYPDGFKFIESQPVSNNSFNNTWTIGDLNAGQSGTIEFKGKLIGEVGSLQSFNVTASYAPENFNSSFKEAYTYNSQVTSSILEVQLDGPESVLPEKKAEYIIKYRNNSDQVLENIKIIAIYPNNFLFQESQPEPYSRQDDARKFNNQWLFDNLQPYQEGEIKIDGGYIVDQASNSSDFKVQIGFFDDTSQEFSVQQEQSIATSVVDNGLRLNLIVNGSAQDQPVGFGQTLTYSLNYKNLGQYELSDVSFGIKIDSDVVDWSKLEDINSGVVKDDTIVWSKDQVSQFDLIRPLDEGTINISIPIKQADEITISKVSLKTSGLGFAIIPKINEINTDNLKIESQPIVNIINTDVQLKVEGRYFDDDNIAVGTGPLPPVVGQTTTFRIYWSVANSLHNIQNVKVTAALPEGVNWANKFLVSNGKISYNSKDNSVTWSIDSIAASKGFDQNNAWFDIAVTPTKDQVKTLLILTGDTVLTATDQNTNSPVSRTGKSITSNLEDDSVGGGRGVVIDITE